MATSRSNKKGGSSSTTPPVPSPPSSSRRPLYHPPNPSPPSSAASCAFCDAVGGLGGAPPVTVLDIRKDGSFVVDASAPLKSSPLKSSSSSSSSVLAASSAPANSLSAKLASAVKLFHKRSMYRLLFRVAKVPDADGRLWSVHGFHAQSFNGRPSRVIVHVFPVSAGEEVDAPNAKMLAFVSAQPNLVGQSGGFMITHSLDPEFSSAPRASSSSKKPQPPTFSLLRGLKHVVPQPERLLLLDGKSDVLLSVPLRHDALFAGHAHHHAQ